jgi:hypothetical protein
LFYCSNYSLPQEFLGSFKGWLVLEGVGAKRKRKGGGFYVMSCAIKDGSKHSVWLPFMFMVKLIVLYGFFTDLKILHVSQSCPISQQHSFFPY